MMRVPSALHEERAQATVEMAVVLPVLIVLALIVFNLMRFAVAAARFDRVAPDIVLAHGVAPAGDGTGSLSAMQAVADNLREAMEGYGVNVTVDRTVGDSDRTGLFALAGALATYRCEMSYAPWPQGLSIAGVALGGPPVLVHERAVTVDPWRPGVVM